MSEPTVSIILPTHNGSSYLRRSIESCLRQTHHAIELLVVDDGSTDDTAAIIRSFDDPRIRYIRNERNQGLPRSLNIGFARVGGEYLTWTSDDNEFFPQAIETMLRKLTEEPAADFVYADYIAKYLETGETEERRLPDPLRLGEGNGVGACFLYARRVYDAVGGFDPRYELAEDYEYWIRIAKHFRVKHIPQFLYTYGEHRRSLKGSQSLSIRLMDAVLKYRYRYIALPTLSEAMTRFVADAYDHRKSFGECVALWCQAARRLSRLSYRLVLLFAGVSWRWVVLKALDYAVNRPVFLLRAAAMKRRARHFTSTLRGAEGRKNILCAIYSMTVGGSEKVVLSIAQALKPEGTYRFHLVASEQADNSWPQAFSASFDHTLLLPRMPDEEFYETYYAELIRALDIDVLLISHSHTGYLAVPGLKRRFPRLKTIDLLHAEGGGGTQDAYLRVVPYLDRRVCISYRLKRHMIAKYQISEIGGDCAERLTVIHNGIDLAYFDASKTRKGVFRSQFRLADDMKLIAFVGRLSAEKDPLLFVEIAKDVLQRNPSAPIRFVIAGDGPLLGAVKDSIRGYGMEHRFIFTGMLDSVRELLADTYLLLMVSKSEGIPLVATEALAMGVPVVSTCVGAVDELINNDVNGYWISMEENPQEAFVSRISALLSDEEAYQRLCARARHSLQEDFSLEVMGERYGQLLADLTQLPEGAR